MTDIKVGDLVKATLKENPEEVRQGRVVDVRGYGMVSTERQTFYAASYDIEVLDRPAPPIDEELVQGARRAYLAHSTIDQADWKAVINFVREYDQKNATKENA